MLKPSKLQQERSMILKQGTNAGCIIVRLFAIVIFLQFASGCSDESVAPVEQPSSTATIRVPGDWPTMQEAIDTAQTGDTVLVGDGIFTGDGNYDIDLLGKSIVIKSENGPAHTIIDCNGSPDSHHRGFNFAGGEDSATIIDGFTIKNGYSVSGGAVYAVSSSPSIRNCIFQRNTGSTSGGAIRLKGSSSRIENCTFVANSSPTGSAVFYIGSDIPLIKNCVIVFSTDGAAVASGGGSAKPALSCCNVFGNNGGNWVGAIANQAGNVGNKSLDPLFCDTLDADYRILSDSPCAPSNNVCGTLIGALGVGCGQ
jgi:hypothetical protein